MAKIQIIRNGRTIGSVSLTDQAWSGINYVDYIEVDNFDRVTAQFVRDHGMNAACRMQAIVGKVVS